MRHPSIQGQVLGFDEFVQEMEAVGAALFGGPTEARDNIGATETRNNMDTDEATHIIEFGSDDENSSLSSDSDAPGQDQPRQQDPNQNEEGSRVPSTDVEEDPRVNDESINGVDLPNSSTPLEGVDLPNFSTNLEGRNLPRPQPQWPALSWRELPDYLPSHYWGWEPAPRQERYSYFKIAQKKRHDHARIHFLGVLGLFANLADARADYEWADSATYCRIRGRALMPWRDYEIEREKKQNCPIFTYAMLALYSQLVLLPFIKSGGRIEPLAVNPFLGPEPSILVWWGALQTKLVVEDGKWGRLISPVFIHAGILHSAISVMDFFVLCRSIEHTYGTITTTTLFMASAVGGNIVSALMQPGSTLVGPSGGIFGLAGVCLADAVQNRALLPFVFWTTGGRPSTWRMRLCSIAWLCSDILLHIGIGFTPLVDNFASLSGLAYGFLFSWSVIERYPLGSSESKRGSGNKVRYRLWAPRVFGAVFAVSMISLTLYMLYRSDGTKLPCPKCRYFSCLPFPFWTDEKWWYCDGCDAASGEVVREDPKYVFSPTALLIECLFTGDTAEIDVTGSVQRISSLSQDELSQYCRDYC